MIFLLKQATHRMIVRHHETMGHLYVPNLNARLPNECGGYFLKTNSEGFRSNHEFRQPRGERPRIIFLGDSFLAGDNIENAERFSDRIGHILDAETYNYGLSGSGTDQQLLIHEEFASRVEADLIVLAASVDSIQRIQVSHRESIDRVTRERVLVPKPYFTLEGGGLRRHNQSVPRERPGAGTLDTSTRGSGPPAAGAIDAVVNWYRRSPSTQRIRRHVLERLPPLQSLVYRISGIQPYADYRSSESPGWRLMHAILERLFARVAPIPVLLVPLPPYPFLLHRAKPIYQQLYGALENHERGIHVLDITSPLARRSWRERNRLTFQHDPHFSSHGHDEVARLVAGEIERRNLLPARRTASRAGQSHAPGPVAGRAKKQDALRILGVSCFYHDSGACLVEDGRIVAAAEEERFSRVKNDRRFPINAVNYCLEQGGVNQDQLSAVVYYDNAPMTFERLLHAQCVAGEKGEEMWLRFLPSWVRFKLHLPQLIRRVLNYDGTLLQEVHHRSHCASAFFPSPFDSAAILTVDGVGEWATASIAKGEGSEIKLLKEMRFPNSLGLLYSAFTQFTGFKVNSGEYKMMGLAPYGEPRYADRILEKLVDLKDDGSLELNLGYFAFLQRPEMTNEGFETLFDGPARRPETRITQREMDIASSIQVVTEEALLRMARHAKKLTGESNLCIGGGVAFNCVANGRLLREGPFENIWIQPAAGDAGCALGAALDAYHTYFGKAREAVGAGKSAQGGSYLGPEFSKDEIQAFLETHGYRYHVLNGETRSATIAKLLEQEKVTGHFSGRMEFGPRALGARSILADARNQEMQTRLNLKIKYRESFRPFAPTVLAEKVNAYFELNHLSPYMQLVSHIREERRLPFEKGGREDLLEVIKEARSDIPAVTHVDYSARVQTITRADHPAFYDLVKSFGELTGTPVIVNTSFNVRGEPIVCTPYDAYRCFMRTEMDALILGDFLLYKEEQPAWPEARGHVEEPDAPAAPDADDPLTGELAKLFRTEFLPVARALKSRGALAFDTAMSGAASTWRDYDEAQSPERIFAIPGALDSAAPDVEAVAMAMSQYWMPGAGTEALRPLVVRLLKLGLRYPLSDSLDEEVEDAVYVMF